MAFGENFHITWCNDSLAFCVYFLSIFYKDFHSTKIFDSDLCQKDQDFHLVDIVGVLEISLMMTNAVIVQRYAFLEDECHHGDP